MTREVKKIDRGEGLVVVQVTVRDDAALNTPARGRAFLQEVAARPDLLACDRAGEFEHLVCKLDAVGWVIVASASYVDEELCQK